MKARFKLVTGAAGLWRAGARPEPGSPITGDETGRSTARRRVSFGRWGMWGLFGSCAGMVAQRKSNERNQFSISIFVFFGLKRLFNAWFELGSGSAGRWRSGAGCRVPAGQGSIVIIERFRVFTRHQSSMEVCGNRANWMRLVIVLSWIAGARLA